MEKRITILTITKFRYLCHALRNKWKFNLSGSFNGSCFEWIFFRLTIVLIFQANWPTFLRYLLQHNTFSCPIHALLSHHCKHKKPEVFFWTRFLLNSSDLNLHYKFNFSSFFQWFQSQCWDHFQIFEWEKKSYSNVDVREGRDL